MDTQHRQLAAGLALAFAVSFAQAAPINQVAYASLTGTQLITFDDVAGGAAPGTNYDGILVSGGASFGERFLGQTNTPAGDFDVLSGSPSGPLSLVAGEAGRNLNVLVNLDSHVLAGLGPLGWPNFDAIGEGAFAVLFTTDQSEFGFQLVGGDGGTATVDFFRRDGSLIEQIVLRNLTDSFYGFSREGGLADIAGISIFNDDLGGIGFDNLKHDVPTGQAVPEPSTVALMLAGLAYLIGGRRRT
jgi:hypothetical protein